MLNFNEANLINEINKVRPIPKKRNYFEVLQHMKSNDGNMYGRRCFGTLIHGEMNQYWLRKNDSIKNHISLRHSCYATVNTFKRGGSLMTNKHTGRHYYWYHHSDKLVTGLCGLYADLDAKNIGMQHGSQLLSIYPHLLDISELPKPSFVIDSGHGIHLLWLFSREIVIHSPNILPMWQRVEDLFVDSLAKASRTLLGNSKLVDSKVHDPTRYLRVPNSYNCKDGKHKLYVKTLADNHVSYSLMGYHCGLYYDYIGQYSQKWINYKLCNRKRSQAKNQSNQKPDERASVSSISSGLIQRNGGLGKRAYLLINRLSDYKSLIKVRNDEHKYSGYRNELLFLYAQDRIKLNGEYSVLHDTEAVNHLFNSPLSSDELNKILRLSSHNTSDLRQYHYTNAMIISNHHLGITRQEQRHMRTLVGINERKRRKVITDHKSSLRCHKWRKHHGLIGLMTKAKWQRKKLFSKAVRLLKFRSKTSVARELGINRKTLTRWLAAENKVGHFMKRP